MNTSRFRHTISVLAIAILPVGLAGCPAGKSGSGDTLTGQLGLMTKKTP